MSWLLDTAGAVTVSLASVFNPVGSPRKPFSETGNLPRCHPSGNQYLTTTWYGPPFDATLADAEVQELKIGMEGPIESTPRFTSMLCPSISFRSSTVSRKFFPF